MHKVYNEDYISIHENMISITWNLLSHINLEACLDPQKCEEGA